MTEIFEPLKVVKRQLQDVNQSRYRVYKSAEEYVTVEAATALEAIQESGVQEPLKVERVMQFQDRLLEQQRLKPEKGEIAFATGEAEPAELAQTQARADKEADKDSGFSELPFKEGDAQTVINPEAEQEGFVPFARQEEPPAASPVSGEVMEPEAVQPKQPQETPAETLSEEDVAALLQEKPE